MGKIIAFFSGRGGVGKSTLTAALAVSLARLGCSVVAADLDVGLRSLDLLLGMESRMVYDLGDVLEGRRPLDDALVSHLHEPRLRLVCGPPGLADRLSPLDELLRAAAGRCDYLLLDLPAGLGPGVRMSRELADLAALVTTPDRVALRASRTAADALLKGRRIPCRLVVNRVSRESLAAGGVHDLDEALDLVGAPLLGAVPVDPYINFPRGGRSPRRDLFTQKVLDAMARRITGEYVPILLRKV